MSSKQLAENPAYKNYYHLIASTKYRKNLFFKEEIRNTSRIIRQEYPELCDEAKSALWGGKSWTPIPIKDETHLENTISYIQRHMPDNTKV